MSLLNIENNLTELLNDFHDKSDQDKNEIVSEVYSLMYKIAMQNMKRRINNEVSPTLLVSEAFIKLFSDSKRWQDRNHFSAVVSTAMRQIMVDYARASISLKRGGAQSPVTFDEQALGTSLEVNNVILVDSCLEKLKHEDPTLVTVIELKFFVGCTNSEVASSMNLSLRSVNRMWAKAKGILESLLAAEQIDESEI